jgi:hypothetical protein
MLLNGMDTRKLFGEVDTAVGEALATRPSKLDTIDWECWTKELLAEDAAAVNATIEKVCADYGWTVEDYNYIVRRFRNNRHTPKHVLY